MDVLGFLLMGALGSLLWVLMSSKEFKDLLKYETFRHLAVGLIVAYVYSILHSEYNFPNGIMCLVASYMGPDFVQALLEKFKPLRGGEKK
jgi:hypothetical protein